MKQETKFPKLKKVARNWQETRKERKQGTGFSLSLGPKELGGTCSNQVLVLLFWASPRELARNWEGTDTRSWAGNEIRNLSSLCSWRAKELPKNWKGTETRDWVCLVQHVPRNSQGTESETRNRVHRVEQVQRNSQGIAGWNWKNNLSSPHRLSPKEHPKNWEGTEIRK